MNIKKGTIFTIIFNDSVNSISRYLLAQINSMEFSLISLENGNRLQDGLITRRVDYFGNYPFTLSDIENYIGDNYKILKISNTEVI